MRAMGTLCVVAVVMALAGIGAGENHAADSNAPPQVLPSELTPELDGKEVTMTFEVAETYAISGAVPVGSVPFGLRPVLQDDSTRLSVLVSGELADVMGRFNMAPPSGSANGKTIEASGQITVFKPAKDEADQRISYQLNIRDWKKFRLAPSGKSVTLMGMLSEWQYPGSTFNGAESRDAAVSDISSVKSKAVLTTTDPVDKVVGFYQEKLKVDAEGKNLGERRGERITTKRSISVQDDSNGRPLKLHIFAIAEAGSSTTLVVSRTQGEETTHIAWSNFRQLYP